MTNLTRWPNKPTRSLKRVDKKRQTALLVISLIMLAGTLFCQPVAIQTVSG